MSDSFVHLHVHTEYSMLDGAAKVTPLVAETARLGMPALGLTDHGNLHAAPEFYRHTTQAGLTPIIGIEAYVAPGSRLHKKPVFWGTPRTEPGAADDSVGGDVGGRGAYTHMTMLAADATGLRNLFRISTHASFDGFYRKPRVDKDLVAEYADGIIATTGCAGGEVQTRLRLGQVAEAERAAADWRDIVGPGNYYLELMDHNTTVERSVREELLALGRRLDLPPLATNDSHYVTPDQATAHAALLCVQTTKTLTDPTRFKFDGEGYYLKSAVEMRGYWDIEVPGAADNTLAVAQRIGSYDEVFAAVDRMPRVPLADGETEELLLRREVERQLPVRFPDGLPDSYRQRLERELDVICEAGFPGYFLVVGDLVQWARAQRIAIGPGRGSVTGSLVAFVLQISDLDPIEHSLIFERFLNLERVSPPDIDLDFDERRRGEVMQYVIDRWGQDNVAQVVTFDTMKTKGAIKDAARALYGQPGYAIADRITKTLPPAVAAEDIPLFGIFDPKHPRHAEASEVRRLVRDDEQVATILDTAQGLEGLIRNTGVHACAVILSAEPLIDVIPLWRRDDGAVITGWDMGACEAVGLFKMDFLGLRNLTVMGDTIDAVRANHGIDIDPLALPLDDQPTYDLLARGDTLGVFQLDSAAVRNLLRAMAPSHFGDIAAALALYRPGPMAANAHLDYAERSNGRQPITPIHPDLKDALDPILGETYHLLVYQEQVMAIAQQLAGYSLGDADLLRRAMGKKKKAILEREHERFTAGMLINGFSDDAAQTLWDVMIPFAGYAFNKSHTAGYGMIAYWTAYLKANYPTEFMAALLTSLSDKKDKAAVYLAECRRMGIKVLPPDVNESAAAFTAHGTDIRFGLAAVRSVGDAVVDAIITTRERHGRYTSFTDFLTKSELAVCAKRPVESLIKGGAFDSLGHTRLSLIQVFEEAIDAVTGLKRAEAAGQFDLFTDPTTNSGTCSDVSSDVSGDVSGDASPLAHVRLTNDEWPRKQLLAHEREMLGLYVSAHPLDGAEHLLRKYAARPIAAILDDPPTEGEVVLSGMIASVDQRITKQGEPWAIITLEDLDAATEILFFARSWSVFSQDLVADTAVTIKGRVHWREDKMSIFGHAVVPLDISDLDHNPHGQFVIRIDPYTLTDDGVDQLRDTLTSHSGDTPVRLVIDTDQPDTKPITLAVDDHPVTVTAALCGELKSIPGLCLARWGLV